MLAVCTKRNYIDWLWLNYRRSVGLHGLTAKLKINKAYPLKQQVLVCTEN